MTKRQRLLRDAKAGDPVAQRELACEYDFEPPKDRKRAVYWYRRAAEQGDAEAQHFLGECLRDGAGVRKSRREAVVWFRKAAEQGYPDAQVSLGYSYFYGEGVEKDWSEALRWYRKSARQGCPEAQLNIGHMYRRAQVSLKAGAMRFGGISKLPLMARWRPCTGWAGSMAAMKTILQMTLKPSNG